MLHWKPWKAVLGLGLAAFVAVLGGAHVVSAQGSAAGTLPDTVLATVGPDRQVTASMFQSAWTQVEPPARPETLTPESGRRFLDLLIGKEALGAAALRETWDWSAEDSANYGGLRDRLIMKVVLDSALYQARAAAIARGQDSLTAGEIGTLARDEAIAALEPTYDDALLERLAAAFAAVPPPPRDSGLYAALRALGRNPEVDPADLPKVVARWETDEFKAGDLMSYWKTLNPVARPRVETASQVRDLVDNGIFERELRRAAKEREIEFWPEIAEQLFRQREFIAVEHLVDREVYRKIPLDSLTLQQYYRDNERAWDLPPRVRLLRLELPTREAAMTMLDKLRDSSQVRTLQQEAQAAGVSYEAEYTAQIDSVIFDRAMTVGQGGVFGPDESENGWAVTRVIAVKPDGHDPTRKSSRSCGMPFTARRAKSSCRNFSPARGVRWRCT